MPDYQRTPHDFTTGETPAASVFDGLPGGVAGVVTAASATGGIGASPVTVLSRVVTLNASKLHMFLFQCNLESTTVLDKFRITIKDGASTIVYRDHRCYTAGSYETVTVLGFATDLAAGSHTITVTIERVAGSGTGNETSASTSPKALVIFDAGPNS